MNPERILGALVRNALMGGAGLRHRRPTRHRGAGSVLTPGMKGMLGMGALGVAIAAFEHFTKQQKVGAPSFDGNAAGPASRWRGASDRAAASPAAAAREWRGLELDTSSATSSAFSDGLARAWGRRRCAPGTTLSAAVRVVCPEGGDADDSGDDRRRHCDYEIDADERGRIVRTMEESGLDETERKVLLDELEHPKDIATLAAMATTPSLRRDVYLASEMAIDADTKAEQNYLARLAKELTRRRGGRRAAKILADSDLVT